MTSIKNSSPTPISSRRSPRIGEPAGSPFRCWAMTTGEAGMMSQTIGLAEAVGYPFEVKTIRLRAPWAWLPGHLAPGIFWGLAEGSDPLEPPWPDVLITCGRRSVATALSIKRRSSGRTRLVHIQNPQVPLGHFDLVVPLKHDRIAAPNAYITQLALHRITAHKLEQATEQFHDRFAHLPKPLLAVLIGGSNGCYRLTSDTMQHLCRQLLDLVQSQACGMIVTASRRTGRQNESILRRQLDHPSIEVWNGEGDNPYLAMLAVADGLLVTCDSISMVSEACATGKPVHVLELDGGNKRFQRFYENLFQQGWARPFQGRWETWNYSPPTETEDVAQLVRSLVEHRPGS